jgi:IS5 family transposase
MVRRAYRQRSLVEVLLPDADKLWDSTLRQIDALLDDEVLVDRVAEALAQRHPQSQCRGRLGTPAAVVLRMLVLKHLHDWSFDECEREVRGSLVHRAFCRIDGERVPDAKTLIRLARLLDEPVLKDVLARLVALGRERRLVRGRRLRVDTTVVETNMHYPTDATLLADGIRVVTRTLRRLGERVRERTRSVARRVFEIAQRSRTAGSRVRPAVRERSKARMKVLYQGLMGITRAVVRQGEAAVARARGGHHAAHLPATIELVRQVLAQTRARVLRGNTHYPGKVVSLFEPHSEIIRKGKLAKPTEFGRLVKIQEAEAQFITDYAVCERRRRSAPSGHPPSIVTLRSSIAPRSSPSPTAASPRARMNARRRTAGSGTSCCRGSPARRALGWPAWRSAGARGAKAGSARSSAVMGSGGAGTTARAGCSDGWGSGSSPITCWCSVAPGHELPGAGSRRSVWKECRNEHPGRGQKRHPASRAALGHHFCTGK